jgi:hypothetical protein
MSNINFVLLTGELDKVIVKYTAKHKIYLSFILKQLAYTYEDNKIVNKYYNSFFCHCFNETVWQQHNIKEGMKVTIQGELVIYKKGDLIGIDVQKIDIHGLRESQGQDFGEGYSQDSLRTEVPAPSG